MFERKKGIDSITRLLHFFHDSFGLYRDGFTADSVAQGTVVKSQNQID